MKQVRTRFAPSPTGFLHIGGLRTALFCYAWAKKNNGSFILRIEDTDQNRLVTGAIKQIIDSLAWAGITPDEGVVGAKGDEIIQSGDFSPYIQSQRITLYKKYAQELLDAGKAYKCWCTSDRLEEMRAAQRAAKQMPKYDRLCYHLSDQEKAENEGSDAPHVIRFLVPEVESVGWDDIVFGKMKFDGDQIDDLVLLKADGFPTYNFANVIDDHSMQISHVIRGQEFLSSTPKHILLYEAFDWEIPQMVHVAWILGKNKQKLSKRDDAVSVDDYKNMGILPDALNNYLALLGWNPGGDRELYAREDIVKEFEIKDAQKSGAVWDLEKLLWFNGQYIREQDDTAYFAHAIPVLIDAGIIKEEGKEYQNLLGSGMILKEELELILLTEKARIKRFEELPDKVKFFFVDDLEYAKEELIWKKGKLEDIKPILEEVFTRLSQITDWSNDSIQETLKAYVDESDWGVGDVFWPVRVALSGQVQSPGPNEIGAALGKEKTLQRIKYALSLVTS